MDRELYLKTEMLKLIPKFENNSHLKTYVLIKTKRFLIQTTLIFIFQYITIMSLNFSYPALPMYPPMGIAFIMFYLLGSNAFLGLLLGASCAYFLKGLPTMSIFLYLISDIGVGYLSALFCQNILSSDIKPFENLQESLKFIRINAFLTCIISSFIRIMVVILNQKTNLDLKALLYMMIDLWLADLNAILVLSGFLLSWVYLPFSREKISYKTINKLSVIALGIFVILSMFFINKVEFIYFIIIAMLLSIYGSYVYGSLVGTGLLFIMSSIYLAYFITFKEYYLFSFGLVLYTLVPSFLLLFNIFILCRWNKSITFSSS